jgi:hypothetical protein
MSDAMVVDRSQLDGNYFSASLEHPFSNKVLAIDPRNQ